MTVDDGATLEEGPPEPEDVVIVPYDLLWPHRFVEAAGELRAALGDAVERIDHIGSTAVPGLPAKDVIDIQISVASFEPAEAYDEPLRRLGYEQLPDPEEPRHRFYRRPYERPRHVNIHVCESGGAWERRHLQFRDYLRASMDVREAYARLKHEVSDRLRTNRYQYTAAKGPFIRETEQTADDWASASAWAPGPPGA